MMNLGGCLNRRRVAAVWGRAVYSAGRSLHDGNIFGNLSWKHLFRGQAIIEFRSWRRVDCFPSYLFHQHSFSTGFSSVHGDRPSAEYAKLRKESLESEFGHALGTYSSKSVSAFYHFGPFLALYRAAIISFHVAKLTIWHFFVHDIRKRAIKFRETLIRLGPFYTKLGQALSTRPDILPNVYCQELAKLQDQIPPFPNHVAMRSIESQLGAPVSQIFADISQKPIAAASLGQVYKAHLHSGELVAVKVQRPGMSLSLTLDALLFNMIGGQLKRFAKARKDLLVAVNEMVRHMFEEIDYISEAQNAERFASLYAFYPSSDQNNNKRKSAVDGIGNSRKNCIKVPKIYWNFTRKAVLTMEWIDGIKLTDVDRMMEASLNRKQLIDQLVHFVNRDSLGLANDFLSLGFVPEGEDIQLIADALKASFGDESRQTQDFQGIMDQFYDVMYEFDFSLPPDYALVIRALGSLEGTAKALDPDFKVLESAYPFVIGRLLADPNPDMRKILRELLIRNNGSIRWNRLERLVAAISEQASESAEEKSDKSGTNASHARGWKSFDMRSVVAATEDLFHFILSEKGRRVRVFLVKDIIKAGDAFLHGEALRCIFNENHGLRETSDFEGHAMFTRVVNGFLSFRLAVNSAPEVWTAMLIRMALKPEVHRFTLDVISALARHSRLKLPEAFWLCVSRFLHKVDEPHRPDDSPK
ncbi:uncharacterized protein LOC131217240 isoform X3 [Magnolia sinica]|uniref:uncharacterized protein LOC131217240 isoform X3 n=1 Tax=Magnolia sinica TaxID=86752 RepID=UPI002658A686|nr:uncharacterized protein LOC131217240 isoform X3 [Magnolia sinica]